MTTDLTLSKHDPELYKLILQEQKRQRSSIELIASENFTSRAVMECLGSCLTNKYSEGTVGKRYYGGNEIIDQIEALCQTRALNAFGLNKDLWDVNVQPYSGSVANIAAFNAVLQPGDRIMGLDLPSGGHLSHGAKTGKKKINCSSIFYQSLAYHVTEEGLVDYEEIEKQANNFYPDLIICGGSAYPRDWDYKRLREICDKVGAYLLCDMAHYSGLVATKEHNNPFDYSDLVTTTTHKSLRGPRAGMIFSRKDKGLNSRVNFSVFPNVQGGPHDNKIAAIATQLKDVDTPEFKQYVVQLKKNAKALAQKLMDYGYKLVTNGTDNHLILWNLRPEKITGSKLEKYFEHVHISLNKNSIVGDKSALTPYGIRIGTPAMTTRGLKEKDFEKVAEFLHRGVVLSKKAQESASSKKIVDFMEKVEACEETVKLGKEIEEFALNFELPGLMHPELE